MRLSARNRERQHGAPLQKVEVTLSTKRGHVVRAECEDGIVRTIHPPFFVSVCAWCVPPSEQQPLKDAGFNLSHGICRHCLERQRGKEAA